MKIETVDVNRKASSTSRINKCWSSYHQWINSPKCNKVMTIAFCVSVLTLFFLMVTLTMWRSDFSPNDERIAENNECDCSVQSQSQLSSAYQKDHNPLNDSDIEPDIDYTSCRVKSNCRISCYDVYDSHLYKLISFLLEQDHGCSSGFGLELEKCKFSDGYLKEAWLSELEKLDLKINQLDIYDSNLTHILPDALDSDVFRLTLTTITIDNAAADDQFKFTFVSKSSFKGLTFLSTLILMNVPSLEVLDKTTFEYLNDSLTTLKISRVADPWAPSSLLGSIKLSKLTFMDLEGNNFPYVNSSSFSGIAENVKTLYLSNSKIQSMAVNTFNKFEALQLLNLQGNLLTTINTDVFKNLLKISGLTVNLQKNQWHCDCALIDIQNMILGNRGVFTGVINCVTPSDFQDVEIIFAELCPEPTTEVTIETTIETTQETAVVTTPDVTSADTTQEITEEPTEITEITEEATTIDTTQEDTTIETTIEVTEATTEEATEASPASSPEDPDCSSEDDTKCLTDTVPITLNTTPEEPLTDPTNATEPTEDTSTEVTTSSIPSSRATSWSTSTPTLPTETTDVTEPTDSSSTTTEESTTQINTIASTPTTNATETSPNTSPSTSPTTSQSTSSKTYPSDDTTSDGTTSYTSTNYPTNYLVLDIECYRGTVQSRSRNLSADHSLQETLGKASPSKEYEMIKLTRPVVYFDFEDGQSETEVQISFDNIYYYVNDIFLVYYPGFIDASELDNENVNGSVHCQIIWSPNIVIKNLLPSTVYTFCALIRNQSIQTPFQCKSYQSPTPFKRQPWIYQEQKAVLLTVFMLLLLVSLVVGVIMTYFMIRRMPTLMRGSKRVVLVNNSSKDVMVMPSGTRSNSWQKETTTTFKQEAPTYLTPLPRQSFDHHHKQVLGRSNSDTSLRSARSYVSMERCARPPPRFSQVFQPSDFKHELPRRCGSFPHSHPTAPCHSPDPIPPPLPRRSIASTASTVEMRKPSNNSIYRRQPSRISDDETENHYNFII